MKSLLYSLVWLGCVVGIVSVQAQEREKERMPADPAREAAMTAERQAWDQQTGEIRTQMGQVEQGLYAVRVRLGLAGSREKGGVKDEEILKLMDASTAANKALEQKGAEVLKADAEGGPIVAQIAELQNKMNDLQKQRAELEKSLWPIRQRLGLQGGRGEKGGAPASANPEVAALRATADAAQKALDDKITELVKADPDGAKLLQQRDELNAKMNDLREHARERKADR